jgi:hypothetical protein
MVGRALGPPDVHDIRFAQSRGRLDKRIEHRLQIECRAADNLEHVGRGGLLLQRFTQIVRALTQLVEQPSILDGDDGLAGEIGEQGDLLVGERTNFLAIDDDDSNELIVFEHRHSDLGANATKLDCGDRRRVPFGINSCRCKVGGLQCLLGSNHLAERTARRRMERIVSARLEECRWHFVRRDHAKSALAIEKEGAEIGLAEPRPVRQHGLEDRRELAW